MATRSEIAHYLFDCGLVAGHRDFHIPDSTISIHVGEGFSLLVYDTNNPDTLCRFPSEGFIRDLATLDAAAYELFEWLDGPAGTASCSPGSPAGSSSG